MKRIPCDRCRQLVGQATLIPYDEDLEPADVLLDLTPSLHGRIKIVDVAQALAVLAPRAAGQYRLHAETCRRRP